jgi:hypothetical protein
MTTQDAPVEITDEQLDDPAVGPIQLRAALKAQREENATLRAGQMTQAYKDAGLDPAMGLGKAIAKEYDGDMTPEALTEYARDEYGWTPPEAPAHPQEQQIVTEQARLDQAGATAGSIVTPTTDDELAKAELDGDWNRTMAIKGQQIADMF